ncbi:hypothetical protein BJP36_38505 [Moorena producens JHB]|uniref:Uncharacterized protein n=1 Tax=Moorena producens (strain JHB) TaxID=1454205 RepID=A0A9Q9SUP7_MOOP1|nr:hypothetical protein [Moorena producens]WAN69972.1 hypothetical protein BJP36_38505 [Moorena producens JHB]
MAYWPRFANNLQPSTLAKRPRDRVQPNNLGLLATLREQPSTLAKRPRDRVQPNNLQPSTVNKKSIPQSPTSPNS